MKPETNDVDKFMLTDLNRHNKNKRCWNTILNMTDPPNPIQGEVTRASDTFQE